MFVAFVLMFPSGVLWAKFRDKGNPDRILRHKQVQFTATVLALVAFILAIVYVGDNGEHFEGLHAASGLVTVIILVAQMLIAPLRPAFGSALRHPWQLFHIWIGRLLFVLGPIVSFFGAGLYVLEFGPELSVLVYAGIVITIVIWVVAAILGIKELRA